MPANDARVSWLTGLKKILQNTQLSYLFIRDALSRPTWWQARVSEFEETEIATHIKEYEVGVRIMLIQLVQAVLEESMRRIIDQVDPVACKGRAGRASFYSVYSDLLSRTSLERQQPVFNLLRLSRNTLHTNGVFRPVDGKDARVAFRGQTFEFRVGQRVGFLSLGLLLPLTEDVAVATYEIVTRPPVVGLRVVSRKL